MKKFMPTSFVFMATLVLNACKITAAPTGDGGFTPTGSDQGFRYNAARGRCEANERTGYNDKYLGECGRFESVTINNVRWSAQNLKGARFYKCKLPRALLSSSDFEGADLRYSEFKEADATHAKFINADLSFANFDSAKLRNADLQGADLREAKLFDADLSYANLRNTDLSEAKLRKAKLGYAKLQGARLLGADLDHVDLRFAEFNSQTLLPFSPAEAISRGMIRVE